MIGFPDVVEVEGWGNAKKRISIIFKKKNGEKNLKMFYTALLLCYCQKFAKYHKFMKIFYSKTFSSVVLKFKVFKQFI